MNTTPKRTLAAIGITLAASCGVPWVAHADNPWHCEQQLLDELCTNGVDPAIICYTVPMIGPGAPPVGSCRDTRTGNYVPHP